jgi:hypothetical protein
MDPALREQYLQMANDQPNILCSELPMEILEEVTYDDSDPSDFFKEFLHAGHSQWLAHKFGRRIQLPEEIMRDAVLVLWVRACRLYISRTLDQPDADDSKPFFSNEGLFRD